MKVFIALLKADLHRALLSLNFIISTIFIMFVMFISCSGFIADTSDVIALIDHALTGSGSTLFILCIAPILPYGMSYAVDLEDRALPFWVIRTGTKQYAISKFISSAIAGFLSVFLSIVIFSQIMSVFFPLLNSMTTGGSYAVLLENNRIGMYILAIATHYGLSATLFAGAAMVVSAFIPNRFTVMAAPIVVYFVLMRLTDNALLPYFLRVSALVQDIYHGVSPLGAFLYKLIPVLCVLNILLSITVKQIDKRVGSS